MQLLSVMTMRTIGAMSLNHYEKVLQVGSKKNVHQEGRNKHFVVLYFVDTDTSLNS